MVSTTFVMNYFFSGDLGTLLFGTDRPQPIAGLGVGLLLLVRSPAPVQHPDQVRDGDAGGFPNGLRLPGACRHLGVRRKAQVVEAHVCG